MFNSYDPMKLVKEMHKVNKEVSVQTGKTYIRNHEIPSHNERGCIGWALKIVT